MKKSKKKKFSKLVVAFSISTVLIYTSVSLILQFVTQTEVSPTLTTCFYSFFAVELFSVAGIKFSKVKYSEDYTTNIDESEDN